MTIHEALRLGHTTLQSTLHYPEQAWKEAEILLAFVLNKERTWLVAHDEEKLSARQTKRFLSLIGRRAQHEPLAYLRGSVEFCGYPFEVNKHVLIPRIETEELVERASASIHQKNDVVVWDVGTGSGAISISIKKRFPHIKVITSDVSGRALTVAKRNADRLLSAERVTFLQGSLLSSTIKKELLSHEPKHLFVLANLPYLPHSDKEVLQKDVVAYEPASALFADEEGNALILKLAKQLAIFIKEHSLSLAAYFEFDPPQAKVLKDRIKKLFPKAMVTLHTDTCGRERFLQIDTVRNEPSPSDPA
jgi:release factor glutamine methyltransferase